MIKHCCCCWHLYMKSIVKDFKPKQSRPPTQGHAVFNDYYF